MGSAGLLFFGLAAGGIRECGHRVVLPRLKRGKRRQLRRTGILVINMNNLKSPITLCLAKTKMNAVKLVSSSIMDIDGLRHRMLCDRTRMNVPGTVRTGGHLRTLGRSMRVGTCPAELAGRGTSRVVHACSVVVSKYSGFTAHCLVGSVYIG